VFPQIVIQYVKYVLLITVQIHWLESWSLSNANDLPWSSVSFYKARIEIVVRLLGSYCIVIHRHGRVTFVVVLVTFVVTRCKSSYIVPRRNDAVVVLRGIGQKIVLVRCTSLLNRPTSFCIVLAPFYIVVEDEQNHNGSTTIRNDSQRPRTTTGDCTTNTQRMSNIRGGATTVLNISKLSWCLCDLRDVQRIIYRTTTDPQESQRRRRIAPRMYIRCRSL